MVHPESSRGPSCGRGVQRCPPLGPGPAQAAHPPPQCQVFCPPAVLTGRSSCLLAAPATRTPCLWVWGDLSCLPRRRLYAPGAARWRELRGHPVPLLKAPTGHQAFAAVLLMSGIPAELPPPIQLAPHTCRCLSPATDTRPAKGGQRLGEPCRPLGSACSRKGLLWSACPEEEQPGSIRGARPSRQPTDLGPGSACVLPLAPEILTVFLKE